MVDAPETVWVNPHDFETNAAGKVQYVRADRIEALERELAENKRRNAELDREITGLRNSYWEERKAHLAAEAREARLSEALQECIGYITSPLRLSDDGDEVARRNSIAVRARAALSGSNSGWRAMDSAPKAGQEILVAWKHRCGDGYSIFIGRWKNRYGWVDQDSNQFSSDPDLWAPLPLPAAPQPTGGE